MRLSLPIFLTAAPAIAAGAWLLGLPLWGALACGVVFGLVAASPDLRGDRWTSGRGPFRPAVPALPHDARPGDTTWRAWAFLPGLPVLLAAPWSGLVPCVVAWVGVALLVNGLASWVTGQAVPLLGVRWVAVWRREASPWLYWGSTCVDLGVGAVMAAAAVAAVF